MSPQKAEQGPNPSISFKELPANLRLFILVCTVFSMGHFGYAFLLLKACQIGLTNRAAIFLYVLFYTVYTLCSIPSGILSDRIGRRPVLMVGYLLFAGISLGLVFTSNTATMVLFFLVYGLFFALIDGVQRAFVVDLAPKHLTATALGTFHAAIGMVALPGGFLAGLLWDKIGPEATFLFGFSLALLSATILLFVKDHRVSQH